MPKIADPITRITCVVCGLVAEGASPRVCVFCAERPRAIIKGTWVVVDGCRVTQTTAGHQVAQALDQADTATQERWQTFMTALTAGDARAVSTLDIIRIGMASNPPKPVGVFADICRLYLAWQDSQDILAERYAWAEQVETAMAEFSWANRFVGVSPVVAASPEVDKQRAAQSFLDATLGAPPRQHEWEVPPDARIDYCHSCDQEIVWIKTPKGKAMPLSVKTIERRNGARYALAHFSDCPEGKGWSKR